METLFMAQHNIGRNVHPRKTTHDAMPVFRVASHRAPFCLVEGAVFKQDGIGYANLAYIVQQRTPVDLAQKIIVIAEAARQHLRMAGDAPRMEPGFVLAQIERLCKRLGEPCQRRRIGRA